MIWQFKLIYMFMTLRYKDWLNEGVNVLSYHKKLDPTFWDENDHLDPKIREKLIQIAKDFFESTKFETEIIDIYFMGSMANFNYTELSDLDTHIAIDFEDVGDPELVKRIVDGDKFQWNMRHNISLRGHDVELYIQDKDEKVSSAGIYSLMKDEWVQKPTYNPPDVKDEDINPKYNSYVYDITQLEKIANEETDVDELKKYHDMANDIKKKLTDARKVGVKEKGEFSIENLVFKKLRNEGFVGKLIDVKNQLYDKMFVQ